MKMRGSIYVTFALLFLPFMTIACTPVCDEVSLTPCPDVDVVVTRGQCVKIPNPCREGGEWFSTDVIYFVLCPRSKAESSPLYVSSYEGVAASIDRPSSGYVAICAPEDADAYRHYPFKWYYGPDSPSQTVRGTINVTVVDPISVIATASPKDVKVGNSSQLEAVVAGGEGSYTYSWAPASSLSNFAISNPVATPYSTTTYTVTVTDSSGLIGNATVPVSVGASKDLDVTATPSTIKVGKSAQLNAVLSGAVSPITYNWTSNSPFSLDDNTVQNPIATPDYTTDYFCNVTDVFGTYNGSVTVVVNVDVTAAANPATVTIADGKSNLLAAVKGGTPPYTYVWSPADLLDDSTVQYPVATVQATTSYTVLVTDSEGATATDSVTVTSSALRAHARTISEIPNETVFLDPSGSTPLGAITEYHYYCEYEYDPDQIPDFISPTPVLYRCGYELPGLHILAVEVFDADGNSDFDTVGHGTGP